MYDFSQSKQQGGLEPWHPLEEIGATILEGEPKQSGRIDYGSLETPIIVGVWECTQGKFSITYPWNELATILEGSTTITNELLTFKITTLAISLSEMCWVAAISWAVKACG